MNANETINRKLKRSRQTQMKVHEMNRMGSPSNIRVEFLYIECSCFERVSRERIATIDVGGFGEVWGLAEVGRVTDGTRFPSETLALVWLTIIPSVCSN